MSSRTGVKKPTYPPPFPGPRVGAATIRRTFPVRRRRPAARTVRRYPAHINMVGPWPCLPCLAARPGGGRWDVSPPFAEGANSGEQFTRDAGSPPPGLGATHLITQNEKSKTKVRRPGLYGSVWGPDICWAGLVYSLFVAVFSSFSSVRRRPGPGLVRLSAGPSVCRWAGLPACWPARPAALVPAQPNSLARPDFAALDSSRVRFGGVSGEKSTRGQEEADRQQLPSPPCAPRGPG